MINRKHFIIIADFVFDKDVGFVLHLKRSFNHYVNYVPLCKISGT